jgi:aminoglycoside phosphotransferase (APT) family kinase protein
VRRDIAASIPERLQRYLATKLPEVHDIRVGNLFRCPSGNSRAMWFFDAVWTGEAPISKTLALRTNESTCFREPEVSLEKEFRVYRTLEGTSVPTIRNYWYESDPEWFGEPFVIRERMEGVEATMNGAPQEVKEAVLESFIEVLAAQHLLDWRKLGLDWLGAPSSLESCAEELLETWIGVFRRDQVCPDPLLAAAAAELRAMPKPVASRVSLAQGQVGPNQLLWLDGKVLATLDWESCFLGDPISDLAFLAMNSQAHVDAAFLDHLFDRYATLTGIPVDPDSLAYYTRFQSFWCAVVTATGFGRFHTGEMRKVETLRLSTLLSRPFVHRLEHIVTGL